MQLKDIDNKIKAVAKSTTNLNNLVQETAVGILEHAKTHGDVTRALALVNALPVSFRREMLINWFAHYAPIGIDVKGQKVAKIDARSKRFRDFDVDGAKANPWFNPDSVPANQRPEALPNTLMEFEKNVLNFIQRMKDAVNDPKKYVDTHREEMLTQLNEMEAIAKRYENVAKRTALEEQMRALEQADEQGVSG